MKLALLIAHVMAGAVSVGTMESAHAEPAADLAHCSEISAPETRLACYDALAGRPADSIARTTSAPVKAPASDPKNFGLKPVQLNPVAVGPEAIHALITKVGANQLGQAYVVLDSGQTWALNDADGRLTTGDAVTIKRASLGSFVMTSPANHAYHVHRLQ